MVQQNPETGGRPEVSAGEKTKPYPDANALYLIVGGSLFFMVAGVLSLQSPFLLIQGYAGLVFMCGYLAWIFAIPIVLFYGAKKLHAGTRTKTRFFHVSTWGPWEWAILEFFFAIIFLLLYALKRRKIYELNRREEEM